MGDKKILIAGVDHQFMRESEEFDLVSKNTDSIIEEYRLLVPPDFIRDSRSRSEIIVSNMNLNEILYEYNLIKRKMSKKSSTIRRLIVARHKEIFK